MAAPERDNDLQGLSSILDRLTSELSPDNDNKETLLSRLQGLVTNIKWSLTDITELLKVLLKRLKSLPTNERKSLTSWMVKLLYSIEMNNVTPSFRLENGKTIMQIVSDETTTENVFELLDKNEEKNIDEILEEIRQHELNDLNQLNLDNVKNIVLSVTKLLNSDNNGSQLHDLEQVLYNLCVAVHRTKSYIPRLTQMVSWCIMALSKSGWLIQVGTGEGKSCIVAMFAAFRALKGEKVDIMSSSPVLADRDFKEWKTFYKHLNIRVACNANKVDANDLKTCYEEHVVYGTSEQFAGDWLRHNFKRTDILGNRHFQCAIVDEVDSLMLDKGSHVVYLSSDMPAMAHLNSLLALIWVTVNKYSKIDSQTTAGPIHPFHYVVLQNIIEDEGVNQITILQMAEDAGILSSGSVQDIKNNPKLLLDKIGNVTAHQLAEFFKIVEVKFPLCHFVLHVKHEDGTVEKLNQRQDKDKESEICRVPLLFFKGGFCRYMYTEHDSVIKSAAERIYGKLCFTPCELSDDIEHVCVPGFLKDFVMAKLTDWIENAFHAQTMTPGHEYIIEGHAIVPVDYSCTGVVENNMKWSEGLQQFLEFKHQSQVKPTDMTVTTNYMSNVGLLQMYGDQIYGISGTLGQRSETETLQKLYTDIKTCQIPSFKPRKLFEVEGVIADNEQEWIEKICEVVLAQIRPATYRAERAVLVICETINRAGTLHCALGDRVKEKKLYINNNEDNSAIFKKNLEAGDVIIATNLAGRGTDLKVSDQVNKAGGLFVVQTFLPKNARVEQQAFGRTARQGSPGSAQLLVCSSHLPEDLQIVISLSELQSSMEHLIDVMSLKTFFAPQVMYSAHILTKTSDTGIKIAKLTRDHNVKNKLAKYLNNNIPNLKMKQDLFNQYLLILDNLYKSIDEQPVKPLDSHVSALNETWGMWLLMRCAETESIEALRSRLDTDMTMAMQKLTLGESPMSNLHHYTAFGNNLFAKGNHTGAISMYTKAINQDQCWAAFALYNRAFVSLAQKERNQEFISQSLEDLTNALKSIEFYQTQIQVTHLYSRLTTENPLGDSATRLDKHIRAKYQVLEPLKENIKGSIKKLEKTRDMGGYVKVAKLPVFFMAPLELLNPDAIMGIVQTKLLVPQSQRQTKLQKIINCPSFDYLRELMNLESLGLESIFILDTCFSFAGFFSKIFNIK